MASDTILPESDKVLEKQHEGDLEQEKVEALKEKKIIEKTDERLRELVPNDYLYEAMENFLLGDPENQIAQLGDVDSVLRKGDEENSKGQKLMARAQYETSAKIAIYNLDGEAARKILELASQVTDPKDKHAFMQQTILQNLDEVLRVSKRVLQDQEQNHRRRGSEGQDRGRAASKEPSREKLGIFYIREIFSTPFMNQSAGPTSEGFVNVLGYKSILRKFCTLWKNQGHSLVPPRRPWYSAQLPVAPRGSWQGAATELFSTISWASGNRRCPRTSTCFRSNTAWRKWKLSGRKCTRERSTSSARATAVYSRSHTL